MQAWVEKLGSKERSSDTIHVDRIGLSYQMSIKKATRRARWVLRI